MPLTSPPRPSTSSISHWRAFVGVPSKVFVCESCDVSWTADDVCWVCGSEGARLIDLMNRSTRAISA